jgi:hypothetical protein
MKGCGDSLLLVLLILVWFVHNLPSFLFVRYGKRTTQGILNDLRNSLSRYYLNNFADGTKQVNCWLIHHCDGACQLFF